MRVYSGITRPKSDYTCLGFGADDEVRTHDPNSSKTQKPDQLWSSFGAGDEIRTRDPQLGKLMLYQLSYTRNTYVGIYRTLANVAEFGGICKGKLTECKSLHNFYTPTLKSALLHANFNADASTLNLTLPSRIPSL